MAQKPKICVIGGGRFGLMHLRAFRQLANEGRCEFLALADVNEQLLEERAREFGMRTYADYGEMLDRERPDGVTIATPDHMHREIALAAIERGVHVFVEKPLDVTARGCRQIIDAAAGGGLLLEVDFHKRYDPYHLELHRLAREGKFGEIEYGYAWMEDRIEVPRDWWPSWAGESSPGWFLAIHMIDLFRWIARTRGCSVYATGAKKKLASLGLDAWDSISIAVEMERDISFQCQVSWILPDAFEAIVNQGIRIVGTEGIMEVDSQDRGAESCFAADGRMATHNLGFFRETKDKAGRTVYGGYGIEAIADFADNLAFLLDGGKPDELAGKYPDGLDGLEATKIVAAAHESLATGRLIDIT
ncbi:MAG: Gfo/Idh/MocA family oxidoreductase [Candidatus Brocadiae bacterium]|nr:Gfo/Idh/MocA family oxidoreductase [Candidatus Brocadiia bacterium]